MKNTNKTKKLASLAIAFAIVLTLFTLAPVAVSAKGDAFSTISAGSYHMMAIKNDGSLWAWGRNLNGQLGNGTSTNYRQANPAPMKVMDDVTQVSAGEDYTVAIKNDGSLWAWGQNGRGRIGDGTTDQRVTPVKVMDDVVQVSAGGMHTMAIKNDGNLWAWGRNDNGKLGDGTIEDRHTPIKIIDGVAQVSAGRYHTMAIKSDGSLWAWGRNWYGQLGDGTAGEKDGKLTPVKIMDNVVQVSADRSHTLAIKNDGSLWAWGYNTYGQLGDGTVSDHKLTPIKIMDNVVRVSAGDCYTLAIKNDGSLWAWGENTYHQLGYDESYNSIVGSTAWTPMKIMDDVIQVSAGELHTVAVKSDGSLWGWGRNFNGEIGIRAGGIERNPTKIMDGVMLPGESIHIKIPIISETIEALNSTLVESSEVGSLIRLPTFANDTTIDIHRSETNGELGQLIAENIDAKTFVDVNVVPGETYHYTVEATLDDGTTVQSDSFEVTVQDDLLGADIPGLKSFILMTIDDPEMSVDGHMQEIDPGRGTVPLIRDGRTLVPIRSIIETMDGTVGWEAEESKITLEAYGHIIDMWLNNREIMVDGERQSMDVAPQSINDRTMLPVRFVAENIGCQIAWIGSTQEVIIVFAR